MAYQYDIFLSYSRHQMWPDFVCKWLCPLIEHWVGTELGRPVQIAFDRDLEAGTDWPVGLANRLAGSRVLVPLFSRLYVSSKWCVAEISHMLAREAAGGFRTPARPEGLIVPAYLHDGDHLPELLKRIQGAKLQRYAGVIQHANSPRYEELSELVRDWAPSIVQAIDRAPAFDQAWFQLARDKFEDTLAAPPPQQSTLPSLAG